MSTWSNLRKFFEQVSSYVITGPVGKELRGLSSNSPQVLEFVSQFTGKEQVIVPIFTAITAAEEIAENSFSTFDINGRNIAVCRFRDEYFAIENQCSHARSTFDEGLMRGYRITCPMHGATFDIRDGSVTGAPAKKPIRTFPLRLVDGLIEVNLSPNE